MVRATTARARAGVLVTVAVTVAVLIAGLLDGPAATASARFSAIARAHVIRTVSVAVRATVAAAATATAGSPARQARVTVRVSATAVGRATSSGWATMRRFGASPAAARRAARAAANGEAAYRARTRARAVARSRALVRARGLARQRAQVSARAAAVQHARALAAAAARKAAPAPAGCTSLPKAGGGTWTCTFDEEFNGTRLDPTKWTPVTTAASDLAPGGTCMVDSPANIGVGGGVLTLTVRKLPAPISCQTRAGSFTTAYTGGQVATFSHFSQTYGRFAIRAKFPATTVAGLQSSLWMWPDTPTPGQHDEIDIAEWYSQYADRVIPYLHYAAGPTTYDSIDPLEGTNVVTNNYFLVPNTDQFHEYALEWTPTTLTVFVDDKIVLADNVASTGPAPFAKSFFMLLTACLGQNTDAVTANTPLPASTQIDWVRAWK